MSIFWVRKRKLILSILIGLLIGTIVTSASIYFFREKINSTLFAKTTNEKQEVVALINPVKKGDIITKENIKTIEVNKIIPQIASKDEIIGQKTRLNLHDSMPITKSMIGENKSYEKDDRLYEFSFITLQKSLQVGDVVDIRIKFKTGEDYVVASKKEIFSIIEPKDSNSKGFIEIALNENEILSMSSAFVDNAINPLCEVYVDRYVDAAIQTKSVCNYPINGDVAKLFKDNPNVVKNGNIEKHMAQRLILDKNMKKIVFENTKLVNYDVGNIQINTKTKNGENSNNKVIKTNDKPTDTQPEENKDGNNQISTDNNVGKENVENNEQTDDTNDKEKEKSPAEQVTTQSK